MSVPLITKSVCAAAILGMLLACPAAEAHKKTICLQSGCFEDSTKHLAKHLISSYWSEVVDQDVSGYSSLISKKFQGLNESGHYDRQEQISGLKDLTVTQFKLKNLIAARFGDTIVASYDFIAEGSGVTSGPSLDVWHQKEKCWKLVSHSYVPFKQDPL